MMRRIIFLSALIVATLQTAWAQGFRVYNSDGTVLQFSLRTDSIVFYDGIGSEQDLGLFTPVNQMIVGTWYKSKSESVTFYEDGTTDYNEYGDEWIGASYEFFPFQGNLVIYSNTRARCLLLHVPKLTKDSIIMGRTGASDKFYVYTRTQPVQRVTSITLSETSLTLQPDDVITLTATVFPEDADNKDLIWESSNEDVAEVNGRGRVIANGNGTCVITCRATDGSGMKAECQVKVKTADTMEYVDLGLPSGTLWATCNVGANSPEEYGDHFAWGETKPKSNYTWGTYKWMNAGQSHWSQISKYTYADDNTSACWYIGEAFVGDGLTELQPADDTATANWGGGWQMPSLAQCKELINSSYTTTVWTQVNGVNGRKISSKSNSNSIFLPAAGSRNETFLSSTGSDGRYWSRSLCTNGYSGYAEVLSFDSGYIHDGASDRYHGFCIRPVRKQ